MEPTSSGKYYVGTAGADPDDIKVADRLCCVR
jgi:hypothetical protein